MTRPDVTAALTSPAPGASAPAPVTPAPGASAPGAPAPNPGVLSALVPAALVPPAPASVAGGSRRVPALAVAPVVAAGLATAQAGSGAAADVLGEALYAVLVLLLVSLAAPRLSLRRRAGVAVAFCWVVEVAQATGLPALLVDRWPPVALALGTTFAWRDLAAYAAGVVVAVLVMAACSRGGRGRAAARRS